MILRPLVLVEGRKKLLPAGDVLPGIIGNNMLINGDMRVNQRVFAGGSLSPGVFGFDRWFADTGGCNVSVNAAGVITHTSGTICQAIEAPRGAFGSTVTVAVGDLSGGNLTVSVGGVTGSITPGAGRRYASVPAPASSGTGNLLVKLTGSNVTYREVSVVRGGDMAGFQYIDIGTCLVLSQRFFEKSFPAAVSPGFNAGFDGAQFVTQISAANTRQFGFSTPFFVKKRAPPAVTLFNPGNSNNSPRNQQTNVDCTAPSATGYENNFLLNFTTAPGSSVGHGNGFHWTADAEITS